MVLVQLRLYALKQLVLALRSPKIASVCDYWTCWLAAEYISKI